MSSTSPKLPENYDYPLDDFMHRLVNGFGLDELVEKGRKKEKKARKAAEKRTRRAEKRTRRAEKRTRRAEEEKRIAEEEKRIAEEEAQKIKTDQISAIKKLADRGFSMEEIAQILNFPIEMVRKFF